VTPAPAFVNGVQTRWLRKEWALIAFLWIAYVLNQADRQVVYTLFPALQQEFGFSDAVLGLTGALFLWVYGICSPISGILGDRWSKTNLVVGSLVVWSAFTLLSGVSPNGGFLLACRALLGVSESLFMPAAYALMANAHGPETRSKAVAIFATSQMVGVAVGGSLSGFVAERLHWRASFWMLGCAGLLFAIPLARFFRTIPESFRTGGSYVEKQPASLRSFVQLFRIPSLRIVTLFVAFSTFGLYLVYTWLPTFIYDKFAVGLARAGFEASVYPQIGTLIGLITGGAMADRLYGRVKGARFWVVLAGFAFGGPSIYLLGAGDTLWATRVAGIAFGLFAGFIIANQAPAAFDVVPTPLRASTVGVLNMLGAGISGFAPFLGGLARRTIGVDRLMALTSVTYLITAAIVLYGVLRHFERDQRKAQEP
jgi:predicted MFS family arabinose efflux permease